MTVFLRIANVKMCSSVCCLACFTSRVHFASSWSHFVWLQLFLHLFWASSCIICSGFTWLLLINLCLSLATWTRRDVVMLTSSNESPSCIGGWFGLVGEHQRRPISPQFCHPRRPHLCVSATHDVVIIIILFHVWAIREKILLFPAMVIATWHVSYPHLN